MAELRDPAGTVARTEAAGRPRAGYIDWMRGVAVVIMIFAHAVDSWTVQGEVRKTLPYFWFVVVAGMGAPLFLWLAGLAVPLAAHARMRRGASLAEASWTLQKRGWQIFGLAMLFRLQAYVFSAGGTLAGMLKVDILNIMGLSLVAAAWLWGRGNTARGRITAAAAATLGVLILAPSLRVWSWPALVPDPIEWYLRPHPGRTTFTLFPWSAFVLAGLAHGEWLARATATSPRRFHAWCVGGGAALAAVSYLSSMLPTVLPGSNYWTTSPTFFGVRLGVIIAGFGALYFLLHPGGMWARVSLPRAWSPIELLGRTSLFIYWVHVELAYGLPSRPLHKALSLHAALLACVLFTLGMLALAMAKSRYWDNYAPWRRSSADG